MVSMPMLGDIESCWHPNIGVAQYILDEPFQGLNACWAADDPAMESDIEHFRGVCTLCIKCVKSVFKVAEELIPGIEPLRCGESHVVGIKRVWDDQMMTLRRWNPVG